MSKARSKTERERYPERFFDSPVGHIRDRIVIHEGASIPKEGVFIGLNGYAFLAKPGMEIDLPRPVRQMLDTRIETMTFYDDNGKEHTKDIKRIAYTLVKEGVNLPEPEVTAPQGG